MKNKSKAQEEQQNICVFRDGGRFPQLAMKQVTSNM
jgi:hypothetical protein